MSVSVYVKASYVNRGPAAVASFGRTACAAVASFGAGFPTMPKAPRLSEHGKPPLASDPVPESLILYTTRTGRRAWRGRDERQGSIEAL